MCQFLENDKDICNEDGVADGIHELIKQIQISETASPESQEVRAN